MVLVYPLGLCNLIAGKLLHLRDVRLDFLKALRICSGDVSQDRLPLFGRRVMPARGTAQRLPPHLLTGFGQRPARTAARSSEPVRYIDYIAPRPASALAGDAGCMPRPTELAAPQASPGSKLSSSVGAAGAYSGCGSGAQSGLGCGSGCCCSCGTPRNSSTAAASCSPNCCSATAAFPGAVV